MTYLGRSFNVDLLWGDSWSRARKDQKEKLVLGYWEHGETGTLVLNSVSPCFLYPSTDFSLGSKLYRGLKSPQTSYTLIDLLRKLSCFTGGGGQNYFKGPKGIQHNFRGQKGVTKCFSQEGGAIYFLNCTIIYKRGIVTPRGGIFLGQFFLTGRGSRIGVIKFITHFLFLIPFTLK